MSYTTSEARQVLIGKGAWHAGVVAENRFFNRPEARSALSSARQMHLRELAAETARLQRSLADVFPELVRLQRLEG